MVDRPPSAWLALGSAEPLTRLASSLPEGQIRLVQDPDAFVTALCAERPTLAVVQTPPLRDADLAVAIQERRRRSSLRIVHLSRPRAVAVRIDALRQGVDDAVPDTIGDDELLARLRLQDEQAHTRSGSLIAIADGVVMDPVAHEVRRDGLLVHLRPKEYQLLAMLAGHPGRAYTRRQLLDRVWGIDHDGDPRTVDVHVRWLRSKIEPRPDSPTHLITVRGVGYRLDPQPR